MKNRLPPNIISWFNNRGISTETLDSFGICFNGDKIIIPIYDKNQNLIFNKYRRNPDDVVSPKYQNSKGAQLSLFGINKITKGDTLIICEGELDCMLLFSYGYNAVSSTGGAMTFKEEWLQYIHGFTNTYIIFDNDNAGYKGALKLHLMIPESKIVWLPKKVGNHGDITDYFKNNSKESFEQLLLTAKRYPVPEDKEVFKTKKEIKETKDSYQSRIGELMLEARELRSKYLDDTPITMLVEALTKRYEELSKMYKFFKKNDNKGLVSIKERISKAKTVPITMFVKFNNANCAKCLWHNEKTPSMYYYEKNNRIKCFGCDKSADVVDVVMKVRNVDLKEALKIILND